MSVVPSLDEIEAATLKPLRKLAISMQQSLSSKVDDNFTILLSRFDKLEENLEARDNTIIALEAALKVQDEHHTTITNQLSDQIQLLTERVVTSERQSTTAEQSTRRRQLIISSKIGKLEEATDLRATAVKLLAATGSPVTDTDIDSCFILGRWRDKKRICVELRQQRVRDVILRNRKSLKNKQDGTYGNFYISEGMCPAIAKLDYKCRLLKEAGTIDNTWFYNGRLNIVVIAGGRTDSIGHIQDLYDLFEVNVIDTLERLAK